MPKILTGKVIATGKIPKTITVEVEERRPHPLYRKIVRKTKKYKVHNEDLGVKVGAWVKICQSRPISKEKHFRLLEVRKTEA